MFSREALSNVLIALNCISCCHIRQSWILNQRLGGRSNGPLIFYGSIYSYPQSTLFTTFILNLIFWLLFLVKAVFYMGSRILSRSKVFIEFCQGNEMKSNCFQFHTNLIVIVDTERLKQHIHLTHRTWVLVIMIMLLNAHHDRHHW